MGPGFKYHVVTIAAIFFALTIGLVVGSLFGSPRVPQTTVIAIEALKKSQAILEKNTLDVKQERDTLQTSLHQSLPFALKGRLSGLSLAIVQTSADASGLTNDIRDTLTQAGARVVSITLLERPFNQPDELLLPRLTEQRVGNNRFPADRAELVARFASILQSGESPPSATKNVPANSDASRDIPNNSATDNANSNGANSNSDSASKTFMSELQEAGFLRSEPDSRYDAPARAVILLTGSRSEATSLAQNVDVPLIAALQKAGVPVYACEAQDVTTSSFTAYHAAGLALTAIERANTDPGRWQLVTALANSTP